MTDAKLSKSLFPGFLLAPDAETTTEATAPASAELSQQHDRGRARMYYIPDTMWAGPPFSPAYIV